MADDGAPRVTARVEFVAFLALLLLLPACAAVERQRTADDLAADGHLARGTVRGGQFLLRSYSRLAAPGRPITVYIEGDGLAWVSKSRLSLDPTPINPVALALAARDPGANVVYLARPCQYTPSAMNPSCSSVYWSDRRFSEEVVAAMNAAIDQIVAATPASCLHLVGYSGGGAIAVLIAARRRDVASLRSVAGNLDHQAVNALHQVDPLRGSLNAIDVAQAVARLPQYHFVGGADTVVPPAIAERFRSAANSPCVRTVVVPDASHGSGWPERWPDLLAMVPTCD